MEKAFGAVKRVKRMRDMYIVALTSLANRAKQQVAICLPFTLKFLMYQESDHLSALSLYFSACTKCCQIERRDQVPRVHDKVQPMAGLHASQDHQMRKSEKAPKTPYGSNVKKAAETFI